MRLELFSCSGGMAEGFRRAGLRFDMAVDADEDACASYEANHGHRPVRMDARDLLRMARLGWRPAQDLELVVADPPCTPWSRAGKRLGVRDERDMLGVTTALIALLRPRAYLIGNVPGLDDACNWPHVQTALEPLRRAGYCTRDYASLDAADFGVPQHRVRPFWVGHLAGPCIRWPQPTHCSPEEARQMRIDGRVLRAWVTCREALGHLPLENLGRPVRVRYRAAAAETEAARKKAGKKPRASRFDEPAEVLRAGAPSDLALRAPDANRPPTPPGQPHRAVTAVRDQALLEWPWGRPATTVCADPRIGPPEHHEGSFLSAPNAVVLSERAATILQGFPEDWRFLAPTKAGRWSMLGQAMPPPLAEAVARSVLEQLERTEAAYSQGAVP